MLNSQPHIRINLQEKTLGLDKCWNSFDLSKWCQHKHRDHTHLYHSKLFYTFIMQVTEPNDDYYNEFFSYNMYASQNVLFSLCTYNYVKNYVFHRYCD